MRAIDGDLMRDPFPGLNVCWSTLVLGTGHLIFFGRETERNYPECGYRASFLNVYPLKMFKKACRFLYFFLMFISFCDLLVEVSIIILPRVLLHLYPLG